MDRISALPDELLHVILGLVGDARDVTKTAVLSRRWRHVWVHAKSLRFCSNGDEQHPEKKGSTTTESGFVDWALARRGEETAMESLTIWTSEKTCVSQEQVNEWLRYSGTHVLNSLVVDLYGQKPLATAGRHPSGLPCQGSTRCGCPPRRRRRRITKR